MDVAGSISAGSAQGPSKAIYTLYIHIPRNMWFVCETLNIVWKYIQVDFKSGSIYTYKPHSYYLCIIEPYNAYSFEFSVREPCVVN